MRHLAFAVAAIGFAWAGTAAAQSPAPGPVPPAYGSRAPSAAAAQGDAVAYAQQNLETLATRLAIAPAQASAWNAFVDAVLAQSRHTQMLQERMAQVPSRAPERVARIAETMRRGAEDMAAVAKALQALYPQLDAHQQAIVDQEFSRGPGGGPPSRG
jgi:hypothetical protein